MKRKDRTATSLLIVITLVTGVLLIPRLSVADRLLKRARGDSKLPLLVSLNYHHSTRGIAEHALPILSAVGGRATLALVIHDLERTTVPPDEISDPDAPGGFGNVQPISMGPAGADGLFTGRIYASNPDGHLTDAEIRALAQAGWELAFHGADHTPQSAIVEQVDGEGKLGRAYEAGIGEIRRILDDPGYPVRTNTLASNGWSPEVRVVAASFFDWTEVRWSGWPGHVPVMYSPYQDLHGGFNSIDFQRSAYDGLADLDELVRFARSDSSGWLIIQLHDVVARLEDSPDPPRAMLVEEFAYLVQRLEEAGARFVTFSEGAEAVARDNPGNRLRNTRFARNPFLSRTDQLPMDWGLSVEPPGDGSIDYDANGRLSFSSPDRPARFAATQWISPDLLDGRRFVLRGRADLEGQDGGDLFVRLRGPVGERTGSFDPGTGALCLEVSPSEIGGATFGEWEVRLEIRANDLQGAVVVSNLSLVPLRSGHQRCRHSHQFRH
jgi:peptidoglycan/xylan/chitin deacetylase (PgdA/CDA1 family)